jgi:hypothetical protein
MKFLIICQIRRANLKVKSRLSQKQKTTNLKKIALVIQDPTVKGFITKRELILQGYKPD